MSDHVRIPISNEPGLYAVVDKSDYPPLARFSWRARRHRSTGDISAVVRTRTGRQVYMHRSILRAPAGVQVDHIDRDPLNNRRENLRLCEASVNLQNRRAWGMSPFKGVSPSRGKWRAVIYRGGRQVNLGRFASETEAALAYDRAAVRIYGPLALTNLGER